MDDIAADRTADWVPRAAAEEAEVEGAAAFAHSVEDFWQQLYSLP